jgi:hypothetical protein
LKCLTAKMVISQEIWSNLNEKKIYDIMIID